MTRLAVQLNVFRMLSMIDKVSFLGMKKTLPRASGVREIDVLAKLRVTKYRSNLCRNIEDREGFQKVPTGFTIFLKD